MIRLIIVLLLALPFCLTAQIDKDAERRIGSNEDARFRATILLGLNVAQIDGDLLAGFNKLGFNAGGQVNILLDRNDWVGRFQPSVGIAFSQKGSRSDNNDPLTVQGERFNLSYAQIPVMINYVDHRLVFSAGLAYGQLVFSKFIDISGLDVTDSVADNYNKSEVSFIGGATFYATNNIGLNINWERSLGSLNKQRWQVNRLLSFKLAYTF